MSVRGDLHLVPTPCSVDLADTGDGYVDRDEDDPRGGGLDGGTPPERQAIVEYLLGALMEHHIQDAVDQCGGRGTTAQRRRLYAEARTRVMDRATMPEGIDKNVDRARAVARGEVAW